MKTILLIITIAFSLGVKAQFSRSFYHDWKFKNGQQSLNFYKDGFFYIGATWINEQNHTIEFKIGKVNTGGDLIDSKLSILEYNTTSSTVNLTGFSMNNDGSFNVSIIHYSNSNMETIEFFKIQNSIIVYQNEYANIARNSGIKTLVIDNELVTYVYVNGQGLTRLNIPISDFNQINTEVVNNNANTNTVIKSLDFEVLNGYEYILTRENYIIKRSASNNYQSNVITLASANSMQDYDLFLFQNGLKIAKDFSIYDLNLTSLSISSTVVFNDLEIYNPNSTNTVVRNTSAIEDNGSINMFVKVNSNSWMIKIIGNQIVEKVKMNGTVRSLNFNSGVGFYCSGDCESYLLIENNNTSIGNNFSNSYTPLLMMFNSLASIKNHDEYLSNVNFNKLNVDISIGNNVFSCDYYNTASILFDNQDTLISLLFSGSSSLVGELIDNECFSSNEYDYFNNVGFVPGPFTINYNNKDLTFSKYNRPYFVSKQMISNHISQINVGNQNYIIPFGIKEWPAHGNVNEGQAQYLAEFIDANNNGIYEPHLGDYPKIYGDQCVMTIQSKNSLTNNTKFEWYNYVYSFNCEENVPYKQTLFLKTIYKNLGQDIPEVYMSNFNDIDVGNYNDDYIGTNVELGMIYGYNGDDFDEDNAGKFGFGENTASFGIQFLKGAKIEPDNLDNEIGISQNERPNGLGFDDGVIDNEYSTLESSISYTGAGMAYPFTDPVYCSGFLYAAQGLYNDGSAMSINGVNSKYTYPGESDPMFYGTNGIDPQFVSTEYSMNVPQGDRRIIGSTGHFSLAQNEKIEFDFAYICAIDTLGISSQNSVDILFNYAAQIKNDFAQNQATCGGQFYAQNNKIIKNDNDIITYPNPFENKITIEGLKKNGGLISVLNVEGKILIEKEILNTVENVNLEELKSGIYFVKIDNGHQQSLKKIVKK